MVVVVRSRFWIGRVGCAWTPYLMFCIALQYRLVGLLL